MAAFLKAAGIDPSVFNGNRTVVISNSEQSGAIPPEAMSMLQEMGIDLEKMGLGGVLPTPKKKEAGLLRRPVSYKMKTGHGCPVFPIVLS